MGQDVVGQNFVNRGAERRWGKISGAGGHGAEGSGAGSGSPMQRLRVGEKVFQSTYLSCSCVFITQFQILQPEKA